MFPNFSKVELEYLENQMNLKYHAKSFRFVFYPKYLELIDILKFVLDPHILEDIMA